MMKSLNRVICWLSTTASIVVASVGVVSLCLMLSAVSCREEKLLEKRPWHCNGPPGASLLR